MLRRKVNKIEMKKWWRNKILTWTVANWFNSSQPTILCYNWNSDQLKKNFGLLIYYLFPFSLRDYSWTIQLYFGYWIFQWMDFFSRHCNRKLYWIKLLCQKWYWISSWIDLFLKIAIVYCIKLINFLAKSVLNKVPCL